MVSVLVRQILLLMVSFVGSESVGMRSFYIGGSICIKPEVKPKGIFVLSFKSGCIMKINIVLSRNVQNTT